MGDGACVCDVCGALAALERQPFGLCMLGPLNLSRVIHVGTYVVGMGRNIHSRTGGSRTVHIGMEVQTILRTGVSRHGSGMCLRACWKTLFAQLRHKDCRACCHDSMLSPRNLHSRAMGVRSKSRMYILGHESGRACLGAGQLHIRTGVGSGLRACLLDCCAQMQYRCCMACCHQSSYTGMYMVKVKMHV